MFWVKCSWVREVPFISDAVFPGFLEFLGIGKFPGIGPNIPGIPGNLKKAAFYPYLEVATVNFASKTSILSLFSVIFIHI